MMRFCPLLRTKPGIDLGQHVGPCKERAVASKPANRHAIAAVRRKKRRIMIITMLSPARYSSARVEVCRAMQAARAETREMSAGRRDRMVCRRG